MTWLLVRLLSVPIIWSVHTYRLGVGVGWRRLASVGVGWRRLASVGVGWRRLASVGVGWRRLASVGVGWRRLASVGSLFQPATKTKKKKKW